MGVVQKDQGKGKSCVLWEGGVGGMEGATGKGFFGRVGFLVCMGTKEGVCLTHWWDVWGRGKGFL